MSAPRGIWVVTLAGTALPAGAEARAAVVIGRKLEARELAPGRALDLAFRGTVNPAVLEERLRAAFPGVDVAVQPDRPGRRKRLLIADMDSTIATGETIDELAEAAGVGPRVAAVTAAAMRGELDFREALASRVALLKGLPLESVEAVGRALKASPGAAEFVAAMRAHGAFTMLVSGGFHGPADIMGAAVGFDFVRANHLEAEGGRLTGRVKEPIVDSAMKLRVLKEQAASRGIDLADCLAIGDGANDIPMIEAAGMGIAYRAKPKTRAAARFRIDHTDLRTALHYQGYTVDEIAAARRAA